MNSFAKRLRELMDEQSLTQNRLAKTTKISQSEIARWLSGERKPNLDGLIILADYFDVSIDYLVGRVD